MQFEMLEDNVLLEELSKETAKSNGGILLPDNIRTRPIIARVLAVGEGVKMEDGSRYPMTLKVGDIIVVPVKSGDKLYLDGRELLVVPEKYILMKIKLEN